MNVPRTRVQRRPVHGVLLLDKPLGLSSNQALQKAKWLLRAEKAGHTGTLDPLATGVLPLCFGAATKFSQQHLDADKTYETTLRLGQKTTTADAEGDVIQERDVTCTQERVSEVLSLFTGPISQVPPMHSALKVDGKPLYEYARQGVTLERDVRHIVIHTLSATNMKLTGDAPTLTLRVHCSKGTYIRTLGEDIGEALGCGAHLSALRRVNTGPFEAAECITLEALEAMTDTERQEQLKSVDCLLPSHTVVMLKPDDAGRFLSGVTRKGQWPDLEHVAVHGESPRAFLGSAHVKAGELIPGRLLSPIEIQQILEVEPAAAPTRAGQV